MAKKDLVKVKFLRSPSGSFKLAYHAGDEGLVNREVLPQLLKQGFAELINGGVSGKSETGESGKAKKAETATKEPAKKPGRPKTNKADK